MIRWLAMLGELAEGWKLILLVVQLSRWADFFLTTLFRGRDFRLQKNHFKAKVK